MNNQIVGESLEVLDLRGRKLGTYSKSEALQMAQAKRMNLVQILNGPNGIVCRMEPAKKDRSSEPHEVKIRPGISQHDMDVKLNKIRTFLEKEGVVRLTLIAKVGMSAFLPQQSKEKFSSDGLTIDAQLKIFLTEMLSPLEGLYKIGKQPKAEGKTLSLVLTSKESKPNKESEKGSKKASGHEKENHKENKDKDK